jgi:murein DD-endopeptidase MepM/ murein hydrolase activator NlpD
MKNKKANNMKNTEKKDNSKITDDKSSKSIITKKDSRVLVSKNDENKKSSFHTVKESMISKLNKIFKNIKLQKFNFKYKLQSVTAVCMALVSVLLLLGFSLFDSLSLNPSINSYYSSKSFTLFVNNEKVGTVRDREIIDIAVRKIENEYRDKYNTESVILSSISVLDSNANDSELISNAKLNSSLRSKLDIKSQGYSIRVNGESIGVLKTKEEANQLINDVKNYFTSKYEQDQIVSANFSEDISVEPITIDYNKIDDKNKLFEYILTGTDEKITYTVQQGDTYWDIAAKHNMTVSDLIAANPDANENKLMPGDELSLLVPKPFVNVNIERKLVAEEKIDYDSETQNVSYMYSDEKKVKKAGVYGKANVEYIITEQNGVEISRKEMSREVVSQPQTEVVLVGTQTPPPKEGKGTFINPLVGASISSTYGSRSGIGAGFHKGLDLASKTGAEIKAADGGTVIYSGWNGQYGYMVEISHGSGWSTVYAHCSKLFVNEGDKVFQGQKIAAVGSTGLSTGPHLHFEVKKYKVSKNPSSFIGKQYK